MDCKRYLNSNFAPPCQMKKMDYIFVEELSCAKIRKGIIAYPLVYYRRETFYSTQNYALAPSHFNRLLPEKHILHRPRSEY